MKILIYPNHSTSNSQYCQFVIKIASKNLNLLLSLNSKSIYNLYVEVDTGQSPKYNEYFKIKS